MYTKIIDKMIHELVNRLLKVKRRDFKNQMDLLFQTFPEFEFEEVVYNVVKGALPRIISMELNDEEIEMCVMDEVNELITFRRNMLTSITFKVSVKADDNVYRVFELPYFHDFSTFAYVLISAFNLQGTKVFKCIYKGEEYYSNNAYGEMDDEHLFMELLPISALGMEVGDEFRFIYGDEDAIEFIIEVCDMCLYDAPFSLEQSEIIDGHGIIDEDGNTIDEVIDLGMETESVFEQFVGIAKAYNSLFFHEEDDEFDSKFDDEDDDEFGFLANDRVLMS